MSDEGRRFLRYVMPGLVYGVETLLFLYIVLPEPTVCVLSKVSEKDAFGAIVGVFLASGGLGYIFAAVHHWFLWRFEKGIFDHRTIIKKLRADNNKLIPSDFVGLEEIFKQYDESVKSGKVEKQKRIAQSISLALWYHFSKDQHLGKDGIDHLGNQAHGFGAARIASFFAFITALALVTTVWLTSHEATNLEWLITRYVLLFFLGLSIIWIFDGAYRRVAGFAQETYDITLENECARKKPSAQRARRFRMISGSE
jgi:hypothetical protein